MAATEGVDIPFLASHLGLAEANLTTLPTDPLVTALLQAVVAKAEEFNALYSEKLRVDIELENAVLGSESRCQSYKATAEKAQEEVDQLRQKLKDEGWLQVLSR
jgi:nucleoprotein TPR